MKTNERIDRRRLAALSAGALAFAMTNTGTAQAAPGEVYSLTVCPWTAENPRHDHQQIFPLQDGRLLLVWSEYYVNRPSNIYRSPYSGPGSRDDTPCRISARVSKDKGRTWSEPQQMSPPGGFYPINADHISVHSSGRIILPAFWSPKIWAEGEHFRAFCFYSDDDGHTWQQSKNRIDLPKRGAEEPAIAEAEDGSLVCMLRTTLGKIYQAFSSDRGETWSEAKATVLPSPSSASALKRIPGGTDLLFLWNNATPYALSRPGGKSFHYPRNPLSSAVSRDGGKTWDNIKNIERREGYISGYPSVMFAGDEALVTYYHASESGSRDSDVRLKIFKTAWFYT